MIENWPTKKYSIIYADPPWSYKDKRGNLAQFGAMPYVTMSLEDIKNLPVRDISEKDSVLFLWATMPLLKEAMAVIESWGYKFITCAFVWVKQNPKGYGIYSGLGSWTNSNAELCLLAKRGSPKRLAKNIKQIAILPRGRHSEKPNEIRERITALMGDLPRIELFARERFDGWDAWGNEVD